MLESVRKERARAPEGVSEYMEDDLTVAVRLLEQGATIKEVSEALKYTPFGKKILGGDGMGVDPRGLKIYISNVLDKVNEEYRRKANDSGRICATIYKCRAENFERKYKEYSRDNFGLYQDGKIALALVVEDGFALDTVLDVLKYNSFAKNNRVIDDDYLKSIKESVIGITQRYRAISSYGKESMHNEADIYRYYAKRYKNTIGGAVLTAADDQNIIRQICNDIIRKVYANASMVDRVKDFTNFLNNRLKPIIYSGVKEASPIYCEAGRDKEKYLASCFTDVTMDYKAKIRDSAERYPEAREIYLAQTALINRRTREYSDLCGQSFVDTLAAKELIEQGHSGTNIVKAIKENTVFKPEANSIFKNIGEYARVVLDCAARVIHAEKELVGHDPKEETAAIPENKNVNGRVKNLYYGIMQERIRKTPSFQFELFEPRAERDAIEEIIHSHPDIERKTLSRTLLEISPIAQFPKGEEYVSHLINDAEDRLKRTQEKVHEQNKALQEYNRLRGLATEGVYEDNKPLDALKDGRLAVKMLRRKLNPDEVKQYIVALAKAAAITAPLVYAGTIVLQAQETLRREELIKAYAPANNGSCADIYRTKMRTALEIEGRSQPDMDVRIVKPMLRDKTFRKDEITEVLMKNSPVAVEPGRDEHYAEYVQRQAELELEREEEKIRRYIPVENMNRSEDINEEYDNQKQKVRRYLPTIGLDDLNMLVALNLIASHFSREAVRDKMDAMAPDKAGYGASILNKADTFTKTHESVQESVRKDDKAIVRTLTKITSTEEFSSGGSGEE